MRKRIPKLLTILATAACIFGVVLVAPAESPTLSPMPVAGATPLGNGYDVTCTKANDNEVMCNTSGCPKVSGVYVGDVIHTQINHQLRDMEIGKGCGNTAAERVTINANAPFVYSLQGCRKSTLGSDDCGAWSDYNYVPPAPEPKKRVACPAGSTTPDVEEGQQCTAAPPVQCPAGSTTPTVPAGQQCTAAPPKKCPPGSVAAEVPPDGQCAAPTNTVTMNIEKSGLTNARVTINNSGALGGKCSYNASQQGGLGILPSVSRTVNLDANGSATISDLLWPPLGSTYHVVLSCNGTYDGKQVEFGHVEQDVSSF